MYTTRIGSRIRIDTPAKLNFFLELRGCRGDGFHELDTLMVPIDLYDSLHIQHRSDNQLNLHCQWSAGLNRTVFGGLPKSKDNLAYRALQLLRTQAEKELGADVWLEKRIPSQAGLGGASSDAAAALVAGNRAWELGLSGDELCELAEQLGSDVPFFLANSPARCTGRGEIIQPITMPLPISLVVVKPPVGLSTADVYRVASVSNEQHNMDGLLAGIRNSNVEHIGKRLFNRLEDAARTLTSWIERIARACADSNVIGHQMSGSGTSYFALCRNRRHARQVASRLRASRLGFVFVARTLGPRTA